MWLRRVTVLIITGSLTCSDSSRAYLVRSLASWGLLGSRMGTSLCLPSHLLSCSVRLLCWLGSSVLTKTRPPPTPLRVMGFSMSRATFTPTCFMLQMALWPTMDAPNATSKATFSLALHSKWMPSSLATLAKVLPISEDGVPGYPEARAIPPSTAPRAMASLPIRTTRSPGLSSATGCDI